MNHLKETWRTALALACMGMGMVATPSAFAANDDEIDVYIWQNPIEFGTDNATAKINGTSQSSVIVKKEVVVSGEIELERAFPKETRSTLVLPFTPKNAITGVTFYDLDRVDVDKDGKYQVVIKELNAEPVANRPYIILVKDDVNSLTFNGGTFAKTPSDKSQLIVTKGNWELVGTFEYKGWIPDSRDLGISYGFVGGANKSGLKVGTFAKIGVGAYIYPMRAYLRYKGDVQGVRTAPNMVVKEPEFASLNDLPETMDVVIEENASEETTSLGTVGAREAEFVQNDYFDVKGRSLGEAKPTVKGNFYNKGKKALK